MNWAREWNEMRDTMTRTKLPDPVQDPKWFEPTKVRVLRPFCVKGKRCEIGSETEVPRHVALDLVAIGKAVIL